jgi:DNA-directed RNA polymerase subunit RPC12/RpoP
LARKVVVSTECPACGAPLDFGEGSNAVRCQHCRSNLLVTGRKQILSYFIEPRIQAEKAKAQAGLALKRAHRPARSLRPRLYFVPYYRFTAQQFVWGKPEPVPVPMPIPYEDTGGSAGRVLEWGPWSTTAAGDFLIDLAGRTDRFEHQSVKVRPVTKRSDAPVHLQFRGTKFHDDIEFADHHLDKNFIAADAPDLRMYSIGVRSAVMKLQLFERSKVEKLGQIVRIDIEPGDAWQRALMVDRDRMVYQEIVGSRLSVVYFPTWVVQADSEAAPALVIVDGVSGGVVRDDAPLSLYAALNSGGSIHGDIARFRPLACPNCGWDLPVEPENSIFFCGSCDRSWILEKEKLLRIQHEVADFPAEKKAQTRTYLPFWSCEIVRAGAPARCLVPAFRYRQLKHLQMLSTRLLRTPQPHTRASEHSGRMAGGFYDPEDAVKLARFTGAGLAAADGQRIDRGFELPVGAPKLVWVPFRTQGNYLFDPWFGSNLFASLLA